jgi:hypothetical protein
MKNAKIVYEIKINVEKYKNNIIYLSTTIEELEDGGLVEILIQYDYLLSWSNKNEFTIINRDIILM